MSLKKTIHRLKSIYLDIKINQYKDPSTPPKVGGAQNSRPYTEGHKNYFFLNIDKLLLLSQYVSKNPHLIFETINEIRSSGFKTTITKIKNKYHLIEASISETKKTVALGHVLDLFNEAPIINKFDTSIPIDIVIPVYNGKEYIPPLINSIIKNTTMPFRILICDDKSSDQEIVPLLEKIKERNPKTEIILQKNTENLGFIKTVNKIVAHTNNHFVLLNTDTEVPPFWIERLMRPIFADDKIASTTPFTNSGTICSFPNYLEDNSVYGCASVDEIDRHFQYVNFEKTYIEIPTGVGFCMGVNKNIVNELGMFDECFGKGYGEENDWCQRAVKKGYKNLHITNLFVYHKHGGSFESQEKKTLIRNNLSILNKRHPTYENQLYSLISKNKLRLLRNIINYKIKNSQNYSTLIFSHNLGGGAQDYIYEEIKKRISREETIIFVRYDFNLTKDYLIELITNETTIKLNTNNLVELSKLLLPMKFDEIFINSLAAYPDIEETIKIIQLNKKSSSSKLIVPIHDFLPVCPSYTLLDETMTYCGVPQSEDRCSHCLAKNKRLFRIFEGETSISKWREKWVALLHNSHKIICFSKSSRDIFLKAYPDYAEKIEIIPHNISGRYPKIYQNENKTNQIRIGILGGINEAKGAFVIKNLVEYIEKNKLNAQVILIGQTSIPIKSSYFESTGHYEKEDLPQIVKRKNITQFLIPSIWPETFSYTTEEVMQMGYPLTVFNLGAPAERVQNYKLGKVIEIQDIYKVIFNEPHPPST